MKRITYKQLEGIVERWNKNNNLTNKQKRFISVGNNGSYFYIKYLLEDNKTRCETVPGTSGSLRSCWERVNNLTTEELQ